jgi:hypothetical protein
VWVALLKHIKVAILAQNWFILLLFGSSLLKEPIISVLAQKRVLASSLGLGLSLFFIKNLMILVLAFFFQIQEHSG